MAILALSLVAFLVNIRMKSLEDAPVKLLMKFFLPKFGLKRFFELINLNERSLFYLNNLVLDKTALIILGCLHSI